MILKKCNPCIFVVALVSGSLPIQAISSTPPADKIAKEVQSQRFFHVIHVKGDDHLNMRLDAGVSNDIVATIPFDATGIEWLGDKKMVGKTRWVHIKWKGLTGWVSRYYLQQEVSDKILAEKVDDKAKAAKAKEHGLKLATKTGGTTAELAKKENKQKVVDAPDSKEEPVSLEQPAQATNTSETNTSDNTSSTTEEEWVLQCGNKSPFWQVQIHPKWMNVLKGEYETDLPIVAKKQDKNRWNTALKTVVKGRNGTNNLKMTIKYAYSKRCYDTLSGLRVPYKVVTEFNGEELTGCCRAVKLEKTVPDETKISLK